MKSVHTHRSVLLERLIVAMCLVLAWPTCWAGKWVQQYDLIYSLGENESRASLRKAALEDARRRASSEFGAVVLNKQELRNEELAEQTKLVSAGLVKLVVDSEKVRPQGIGVSVEFRIRAEIDDTELDRQLAAMREDVRKSDLVIRLARENAEMRTRLIELREVIGRTSDEKIAQELMLQLNGLLSKLSANDGEISVAFERGALTKVARSGDAATRDMIERTFIAPLLASKLEMQVMAGSVHGDTLRVPVRLRWTFDMNTMRQQSLAVASPTQEDGIAYADGFCARVYTARGVMPAIADALADEAVALEVAIGSWKERFVIGGSRVVGAFCVVDRSKGGARTVILSMPERLAQDAAGISVKAVRLSGAEKAWKHSVRWDLMSGEF
jgi:hypothetical protein